MRRRTAVADSELLSDALVQDCRSVAALEERVAETVERRGPDDLLVENGGGQDGDRRERGLDAAQLLCWRSRRAPG